MAEYAGYVANQAPVNFGSVASGLASDIISIKEQARKEDMELAQLGYKRKQEQQKQFSEDLSKFTKVDKTIGQSYNQFATKTVRDIAENYYNFFNKHQKGEISASQLSVLKNNLMGVQDGLAAAAKLFNEGATTIQKDSQKQSKIGSVMNQMYANAGDFTNKKLVIDENGNGLLVTTDENGNILKDEPPIDPSSIPAVNQFQDYSVDYTKDLNEWMKSIGNYDVETGKVTIKTPKNNPEFEKAKASKIQQLTGSPREAARFLTEVGDYNAYASEQQKQQLLSQGYKEDQLIKIGIGKGGFPEPILTDKQKEQARNLAEDQINQRISFEKRLDEPRSIKVSTGEGKQTEAKINRQGFLNTSKNIYKSIYNEGKNSSGSAELVDILKKVGWTDIKVGDYIYNGKRVPGKLVLRGENEYGELENRLISNVKDVYKMIYPRDRAGEDITSYDIAVEEAGLPTETPIKKNKTTSTKIVGPKRISAEGWK
jgi:hypothetical protein